MKLKILIFMLIGCLSAYAGEHDHHDHGDHEEHADHRDEEESVHLSEESQKIVGLTILKAQRKPLVSTIEVVGDIAQDTENVKHITPPQAGTLKSLKVKVGDVVEKGTLLGELVTRDGTIIEITSPSHGIVMAKYPKENETLDTISSIFTIADPDLLRASFNVYEKDLAGVKPGLQVIVTSMAYPDKQFEGEIVFVSPQVDVKTRAIRVRANVKNEEHLLKFGMYVSGKILVPVSDEALIIPEEALQDIKGKAVVFTPVSHDEFQIREIKTGKKTPGFIEVIAGLKEHEDIVAQGSFYLKSELLKGELGQGHAH